MLPLVGMMLEGAQRQSSGPSETSALSYGRGLSLGCGSFPEVFHGASFLDAASFLVTRLVVCQPYGQRSESLERHVAFVFAQETQKALVVLRLEVEALNKGLVTALPAFEATADDHAQVVPCEVARNEGLVHHGPE